MKKIILICLLAIAAEITLAQKPVTKSDEPKPQIEFEMLEHDFGKLYDGKSAEFEFKFTNKGKVPLVLTHVQPGCGCTTPEWPREPILPGQQSKIKAIYNPGAFRGNFSKGITVQSNATNSPVQLTIRGSVEDRPTEPKSPVKLEQSGGF